jgi:hypothetical protein
MKLTMVFDAQTDDEADQLATLQTLLQKHPIGRVTTVDDGLTEATAVSRADEPKPATELEAIAAIKEVMERLEGYEVRQRVLAWVAQFAVQAGVTVT